MRRRILARPRQLNGIAAGHWRHPQIGGVAIGIHVWSCHRVRYPLAVGRKFRLGHAMHCDQIVKRHGVLCGFLRFGRARNRKQQQTDPHSASQSAPMLIRSHALLACRKIYQLSNRFLYLISMQHCARLKLPAVILNCAGVNALPAFYSHFDARFSLLDCRRVSFGDLAQHIRAARCRQMRIALAAVIIHRINSVVVIVFQ